MSDPDLARSQNAVAVQLCSREVNNPDLVLFVGEALVGNDAVDQLVKFHRCRRLGGPGGLGTAVSTLANGVNLETVLVAEGCCRQYWVICHGFTLIRGDSGPLDALQPCGKCGLSGWLTAAREVKRVLLPALRVSLACTWTSDIAL